MNALFAKKRDGEEPSIDEKREAGEEGGAESSRSSGSRRKEELVRAQKKCLALLTDVVVVSKLGSKPYVNQAYDESVQVQRCACKSYAKNRKSL